ncbi:ribosomal large subunit pseudouridine synthase B [mine drainage metagenome]|uniref:Ribosomal large subunit pseudouridine synthase B n=1 Tax=mine drainage metagenome TaxID=410659 RepID=A0A1J5SWF5_9ZZZZ
MSNKPFEKFIKPEFKGAKKKEAIRQDKRKAKAESRAIGEEIRKKQWEKKRGIVSDKPEEKRFQKKNFKDSGKKFSEKKSFVPIAKQKDIPVQDSFEPVEINENSPVMPLNKFLAYCGVCGRREAADIIKLGHVTVNGDKIFEPGYKVRGNEDVKVKGKKIFLQRNLVYILLNKPKDYITTSKDPEGRKTVLELIKGATKERVYPVGRLDRNTTGVLLLTNDGELAQQLTHPSFQVKKIYEVKVDKPVTKKDFEAILNGVTLEDGFVQADNLAYADAKDKSVVGIEIHSGRNRIVRRIFEHLGYDVRNLDRVMFANLTKKNVDRGKWRMLQEKEVRLLKYMNQSFTKTKKNA